MAAMATSAMATMGVGTCVCAQSGVKQTSWKTGRALPMVSSSPARKPAARSSVVVTATAARTSKPFFCSENSLSYLDGTYPGDFGWDPLGLSDPKGIGSFVDPGWFRYAELINGRFAMLGATGAIAPEILGKIGLIPQSTALPWFQTGVIPPAGSYGYWADPYTLFVFEIALMGFAEHRRAQDYYRPGSMGKQYFLGLEKFLGGSGDPAYPGGPIFNFANFGKDEKEMAELKLKEVKNGRLAMLAILGYFCQASVTHVGPLQNLIDHVSNPVANNYLTTWTH